MLYCKNRPYLKSSHNRTSGFTLIELLAAIAITGIVAGCITYALSWMLNSNQNLAKEQNRRVEAGRAIDLIASDLAMSTVVDSTDTSRPTLTGITGTIVLDMDIVSGPIQGFTEPTSCADAPKNRIVYSVKNTNGLNVLYRHGLISAANGNINCTESLPSGDGDRIADGISIDNVTQTIPAPTCGATERGAGGVYTCRNGNKISVALYISTQNTKNTAGNYISTKTYGISRTIITGETVAGLAPSAELCTVPNLLTSPTATTNTAAETAIEAVTSPTDTTKTLVSHAIKLDFTNTGNTVLTQHPSAGTRLICDGGLITYTY